MTETDELERLEDLLGKVLVAGIAASTVILAIGLLLQVAGVDAHGVLRAGLLLLIATPILRVAVSVVEYLRIRDWFFAVTSAAVLLVIMASIVLAFTGAD